MVAARNKITPTDVAYSLLEPFQVLARRLEELGNSLSRHSIALVQGQAMLLKDLAERLQDETMGQMLTQRLKLEVTLRMISTHLSAFMERKKAALELAESSLRIMDPKNILKRGYSITWFDGKPLKDAARVSDGDTVITELFEGKFSSRVISKEE
jgi:exodeoxyribonuclease VII large subunit